jgi:WD40 repeat protein
MTTIGHKIAAACGDGTVGIYDSVTGVLRLSLSPAHPIKAMRGSPDGSILFCTGGDNPLVTLWDIQTGGLIHIFTPKQRVKDIAISLKGRYLACSLSGGSVKIWEVANKRECSSSGRGPPVTYLCWLAPEGHLMVASEGLVNIWDVVTGEVLHSFEMQDPVCGAAYSQKLHQLAIATSSGAESTIVLVDPQTGASSASHRVQRRLSSFAFSQTTKEVVCGTMAHGLQLFNVSTRRWRHFDHPTTITSVFTLSNGTVVATVPDSGIQLLSLDEGYAPSRQLIAPTLSVEHFDEDRVITIVPTLRDRIIFLESATMLQHLTIPSKNPTHLADRTPVLCASLKNSMAVHHFGEGGRNNLELWKFGKQLPEWTVGVEDLPSICRISPSGTRLVTFPGHDQTGGYVCIWDVDNGRLLAELSHPWPTRPLDITFDSEDRFYSHHDTYRVLYVVHSLPRCGAPSYSIAHRGQLPLVSQALRRRYYVDDSHEWVVSDTHRICWIPPGFIGPVDASHCWVGSSLVMAGQDGTLRKLTFRG